MASPVAVAGWSWMLSMASDTGLRAVVGLTSTVAEPP
jgi:hypothetical protein